ncbi:MAG: PKD domain-containing protein [Bacteroidia bacterium]|nr:PKD domain-containing protein [Bacteroidia bacterium]
MATNYYNSLMKTGIMLLLGIFFGMISFAQAPKVLFTSGTVTFPENMSSFKIANDVAQSEVIHGNYYRYVQFYSVPEQNIQDQFKTLGIEVIDYIPHNTYLMSIPQAVSKQQLQMLGVRSIVKVGLNQKVDERLWDLPLPEYTTRNGKLMATLIHFEDIPHSYVLNQLAEEGVEILAASPDYANVNVVMDYQDLGAVALLPYVKYVERMPSPAEKEDTDGRALQRSNQINTEIHGGLRFDGEGVNMLVRDDGAVGPHADYKGRMINLVGSPLAGTHGDGVAGVMGGAGNIDPDIEGGASAATLYVTDYFANFLDQNTLDAVNQNGVMITNSSYSNGCNAGYTTITRTVDNQVLANDSLMHVFSAGNSNNLDCGYGAGNQWGNITGGHKVGKNVMAVANLFDNEALVNSSSRGPAHDGRIKPDVAAHGQGQLSTNPNNQYQSFGGTSAAAPSMAGNMGQLYQAYKSIHGVNPPSALVKAAVMNTAHDLGNTGPDFLYGFGRIHTRRAYDLLKDTTYLSSTISQGGTNTHTLDVPAGVHEMRVMVYWVDPAAAVNASKALINDLDMTLTLGTTTFQPYTLNIEPDPALLALPATPGTDTLNNVEQVAIFNPAAGTYTINISGTEVPVGPQEYYIVYTYITEDLKLTYPLGGEGLEPNTQEYIHWDAIDGTLPFTVQYSTTGGALWTNIATNVGANTRLITWTVPNVRSGNVKVRVIRGTSTSESEATFSIMPTPTNIQFSQVCPDSIEFSWSPVSGANSYDAFVLGEKFMDSVGHTTGTSIKVPITNGFNENWVSVRARSNAGAIGKRAIAVQAPVAPLNCGTDVTMSRILSPSGLIQDCSLGSDLSVSIEVRANGDDTLRNVPVSYSLNGGPFIVDTMPGPIAPDNSPYTFTFPVPGAAPTTTGTFPVVAGIGFVPNDVFSGNDTIETTFDIIPGTLNPIPYTEEFDNFSLCSIDPACGNIFCSLSNGWINATNGIVDDADWRVNTGTTPSVGTGPNGDFSPTGNGNYLYTEASGGCTEASNILISPCIDLTTATAPGMKFAYHMLDNQGTPLNNSMGELHVDVFDGVWNNDVIAPIVGPQGANWLEAQVDLNAYKGKVVNIRWRATTGSGFRSDIAIDAVSICDAPTSQFNATLIAGSEYVFQNTTQNAGSLLWIFGDGTTSTQPNPTHTFTSNDTFEVKLVSFGVCGAGSDTSVQTIIVTGVAAPTADFNISDKRVCVNEWVTFSNSSTGLGLNSYRWDFGPNASLTTSTFVGPIRVRFNQRGLQTISFVVGNNVGRDTITKTLLVVDTPVPGFDIDPDGLSVQFLNTSLDGLNYQWSFGDGSTDTLAAPFYTYTDTGIYNVTLIATNECGTDSMTRSLSVPGLNANFGASLDLACIGQQVTFTDSSSGFGLNSYAWSFGPNASTPSANTAGPHTVTFNQAGLQTVQLVVTNSNGEVDTLNRTVFVEVEPVADFTTRSDNGNNIDFTATTQNASSYLWDFGDGSTDSTAVANHIYTSNGSYVVVLVVSNACGSDTTTQVVNVTSVNIDELLEMGISIYPNPNEGKFTVSVENLTQKETRLSVLDMKGKRVYTTTWSSFTTGNNKTVEIPGLAKGVYMLQVQHGDRIGYTKLLIER